MPLKLAKITTIKQLKDYNETIMTECRALICRLKKAHFILFSYPRCLSIFTHKIKLLNSSYNSNIFIFVVHSVQIFLDKLSFQKICYEITNLLFLLFWLSKYNCKKNIFLSFNYLFCFLAYLDTLGSKKTISENDSF